MTERRSFDTQLPSLATGTEGTELNVDAPYGASPAKPVVE